MLLQRNQSGAVTLLVAVVLLIVITLVSIYAAKVGLLDQKISGNDFRAKSAFSAAQAGLDYGEVYIQENVTNFVSDTTDCPDLVTFPCNFAADASWRFFDVDEQDPNPLPSGETFDVAYLISPDNFVTIISRGFSDDTTGTATLRQQVAIRSALNNGPVPPVMAVGVTAGGNFTVVGNPNVRTNSIYQSGSGDSGSSQLFSTFSDSEQNLGGSMQTCNPGDFRDGTNLATSAQCIGPSIPDGMGRIPTWNQCSCRSVYSTGSDKKEDIAERPGHLAFVDTFDYVFQMSRAELKNVATEVKSCDGLGSDAGAGDSSIYWVTGDCDKNGGEMGSLANPIIVVVEGDIGFQGGAHAWGIVMGIDGSLDPPSISNCSDATGIQVVGTFSMHGALISDCTLDLGAGTFNAMYNPDVFDNLKNSTNTNFLSRNVGSWRDF